MYNCSTWEPIGKEITKLEVQWVHLLRRIVKGGYKRKNAPVGRNAVNGDDVDYGYVYTNEDIFKITNCEPLKMFQEKQHLNWLAHCIRMENDCLQKQTLFMKRKRGTIDRWKRLERITYLDQQQLRRLMMDKFSFNRWINERYPSSSRS